MRTKNGTWISYWSKADFQKNAVCVYVSTRKEPIMIFKITNGFEAAMNKASRYIKGVEQGRIRINKKQS